MIETSNILVVGAERPQFKDFGAKFVGTAAEARAYLDQHQPSVLVFGDRIDRAVIDDFDAFCLDVRDRCPDARWILAAPTPVQIMRWANVGCLHEVVENFDDPALPAKLQSALECKGESEQRRQLIHMFEEQSHTMIRLGQDLEKRVQRRWRTLTKSLKTLETTKTKLEALLRALMSIHRAASVPELEHALNESLTGTVPIAWTRVRFDHQSSLINSANVFAVDLPFRLGDQRGQVLFAKAKGETFGEAETLFLTELTDVLALALSRMQKLGQAVISKTEWQSTFDSIPHPLCLITPDFEIVKLNEAFQDACDGRGFRDLLGKHCFDEFFGAEFHPPAGPLTFPFSFRHARTGPTGTEHYEVVGEGVGEAQLILLRNITEEVRFERRILEGSKLAELGTIGSSIAHELNNPLGGMLSFLQLILMDMPKETEISAEVKEMESATLRCRDIVLNLLSFARKQDLGEFKPVDLGDVITRAAKLMELQTRARAIPLEVEITGPAGVSASANALSQALCNLIQNSIDAIEERRRTEPKLDARICVVLESTDDRHVVRVVDNGAGIKPEVQTQIFNPLYTTRDPQKFGGMGLTSAFTLVSEHAGQLEILSQTGSGTTAIVGIPRLD